jgi:hypothetical protein
MNTTPGETCTAGFENLARSASDLRMARRPALLATLMMRGESAFFGYRVEGIGFRVYGTC